MGLHKRSSPAAPCRTGTCSANWSPTTKAIFRPTGFPTNRKQLPKIELQQAPADTARTDAGAAVSGKQARKPRAANPPRAGQQTESQSLQLNKR